jgi:Domain of unknown function (DUF4281)
MQLDPVFTLATSVVLPAWLALALVPYRHAAARTLAGGVALALAALYVALIGAFWAQGEGGFGSLTELARLFDTRGLLLAGWVHYLAFDLLVGAWERGEAERLGLSRWALTPCLGLTFLFGPFGWLLFLAVRWFHVQGRRVVAAA